MPLDVGAQNGQVELGLCLGGDGVKAVVANAPVPAEDLREALDGELPTDLLLVCHQQEWSWWRLCDGAWQRASDGDRLLEAVHGNRVGEALARRVVGTIARQNRSLLGYPQVRGLLSVLKRQFPRTYFYLFELLQNAVDEGAGGA